MENLNSTSDAAGLKMGDRLLSVSFFFAFFAELDIIHDYRQNKIIKMIKFGDNIITIIIWILGKSRSIDKLENKLVA